MSSAEEKPGFTVTDRRGVASDGEPRPEPAPAPTPGTAAERSRSSAADASRPPRTLPPVDFTTFVLSLGSSALMHLGQVEQPGSDRAEKDLPMAKHTIDLLSMLQVKTRGNLTAQEDELLESLLYDLRLGFVSASKG